MNLLPILGETATATIDVSNLTSTLTLSAFTQVIQDLLPIVGVAVLVGFVCYIIRWAIRLFRGI